MLKITHGVVLVARKGNEYWFIDSVFDSNLAGCTGMIVRPITEESMEDLLIIDNLVECFGEYWEERFKEKVKDDCEECHGWTNEDGCEYCGYPSLESFCAEIRNYATVIDNPGYEYVEALDAVCDDKIEYADCISDGSIFDQLRNPNDFDEVYNCKALVACLAFEYGAVSYDYAIRTIFGSASA